MFKRIVAAIDTDTGRATEVIRAASEIGQKFGSEVLIAHVREVERPAAVMAIAGKPGALPSPSTVAFETEERARQLVDSAVDELQRLGVRATGQVGSGIGSTARDLLEIARDHRADLIVVGDRDSRITDVVLGGVAHRIVHLAKCPVLLIR